MQARGSLVSGLSEAALQAGTGPKSYFHTNRLAFPEYCDIHIIPGPSVGVQVLNEIGEVWHVDTVDSDDYVRPW